MDGDKMILQTLMDMLRDLAVTWLVGMSQLWPASSVDGILANVSIPSSLVGAVLAITFTAAAWGVIVTLLATYAGLYVTTGLLKALLSRIGA